MRLIGMTVLVLVVTGCGGQSGDPILVFGVPREGRVEIFAPGFVSTEHREHSALCILPDGREIYFTRQYDGRHDILWSRWEKGAWSEPVPVPFTSDALDDAANFSPGGHRLYFSSHRGIEPGDPPREDTDIWFVERAGEGWGRPVRLGPPVNTSHSESFPSFTAAGAMYLHSNRSGESYDLYVAEPDGDGFSEPVPLGPPLNTGRHEFAPEISLDGSRIIYMQINPPANDEIRLHLSRRLPGGGWSEPVNLAERLGLSRDDLVVAWASRNGRWLFILDGGDIKWTDARLLAEVPLPAGP